MKIKKAYLTGIHRYAFRKGEPAEIIGFEYVQPSDGLESRLAYKLKYADGVVDWVALNDVEAGNWKYTPQAGADFNTVQAVTTVPYQCCPVCNGMGQVVADGFTSSVYQICTVCLGVKIIPMCITNKL